MNSPNLNSGLAPKPVSIIPVRKKTVIDDVDNLPTYVRKLDDEINLNQSLRTMICPVLLSDESRLCALFLLETGPTVDIITGIKSKVEKLGYKFAPVYSYLATQQVMYDFARSSTPANRRSNQSFNSITSNKDSELFQVFSNIVEFCDRNGVSDIHIEICLKELLNPNHRTHVRVRIDGYLCRPQDLVFPTQILLDSIAFIYNFGSKSASDPTFSSNRAQQSQIEFQAPRKKFAFRWASEPSVNGFIVVLRMLQQDAESEIQSLDKLGYLPDQIAAIKRTMEKLGGATVICGVVGSGKSTTTKTMMSMFPEYFAKYSVEDPVESIMPGVIQLSVSRNLSSEVDPFVAIRRSMKRLDLDVALVGETRDKETGGLVRDIAESGHRVLTTLHAPSAIDALLLRLPSNEISIPREVLATSGFINLIIYQALIPLLCPHCKIPGTIPELGKSYVDRLQRLFKIDTSNIFIRNRKGCPHCIRPGLPEINGLKGRKVIAEMIEPDFEMLQLFLHGENGKVKQHIRKTASTDFSSNVTKGKKVIEVGLFHVTQGLIDPRSLEEKFGSFAQYEDEKQRGIN